MQQIPVYFIPGMAANQSIFENIKLDSNRFDLFFLEWKVPNKQETLQDYAKRMAKEIQHKNPVVIGVSFGGVLAQEISSIIPTKKTIIISSVKSNKEFPKRMKFAKFTRIYKLIPMRVVANIEQYIPDKINHKYLKGRKKIYKTYMSVRDEYYLKWSLEQIILWDRKTPDHNVIHIHGSKDEIFPIKYISNCFVVEEGTHIMILNKFRWLNKHLPAFIED